MGGGTREAVREESQVEFTITDRIEFPVDQVYRVHRDCLVELVPYLPSVESITVQSRRETVCASS